MGKTATVRIRDFDLTKTLESGQCFRWERQVDGGYVGVVRERYVYAFQQGNSLFLEPVTQRDLDNLWMSYFDLEKDYEAVNRLIKRQAPWMKEALDFGRGIRILRQEPWETVISFILSSNNHIQRISGIVETLAHRYGSPLGTFRGKSRYGFPSVETLKKLTLDDWKACGAGYRSRYLIQAVHQWETCRRSIENQKFDRGFSPEGADDGHAVRCLLETLPGVGPKVSACIGLFGLGQGNRFPVDVWVRRMVRELWPQGPDKVADIEAQAEHIFGNHAGYAQQLLFYYGQKKPKNTVAHRRQTEGKDQQ